MVRHHSNQYRSQPVPETPLTPRTPRLPHVHRDRLLTPSLSIRRSPGPRPSSSSPSTDLLALSLSRKRQLNLGNKSTNNGSDIDDTPSVALSMNLNVLVLGGSTPATQSPSSRLSDAAIHRHNVSLPFERIPCSPSPTPSKLGEVPHRYPTRTSHIAAEGQRGQEGQVVVSPPRPSTNLNHLTTPPRLTSNATTPPHFNPRQFMNDEANNLFLASSPKAVRNRTLCNNSPRNTEVKPVPSPFLQALGSVRPSPEEVSIKTEEEEEAEEEEGYLQDEAMEDCDDDTIETASTHSSTIDHEKENTTPKFTEDHTNPFLVGGTGALLDMKRAARGQAKDMTSTPSGPSGSSSSSSSQGVVRRSKRLALDSLSPWRWNLEEQYGLLLPYSKGGKGQGSPFIESSGSPTLKHTGQNAVSDWIETTSNRSYSPAPESSSSGGAGSSTLRNRSSNGWTTGSSSSSSSSTTPSIAGPSSSRGAQIRIPDHHPNSSSSDQRHRPSATVAKVTQTIIQPASLAFNRRAQQVAGRIYYWKNGGYHLVNEQDKQQWPGEWKFDVYQDPESPDSVAALSNSYTSPSPTTSSSTNYQGKGKLTDRQLSGPASKRRRLQREPSIGDSSNSPSGRDMELIHKSMTPPPHSTSPSPAGNNTPSSRPHAKLQDRYDFRERRMLNSPLSTPSRRSMA
ncbi:hypothetical protein CPC16_002992 [Podila verticillata]|nr:hypothetical protein CPC16_002992 [Podila verticillata]